MQRSPTRRSVLQSTTIAGIGALAGCLGAAAPGESETSPNASTTPTQPPTSSEDGPPANEWLHTANTVGGREGYRFTDTVEVAVGSGVVPYMFHPAIVTITPETTVKWTWTGLGGANNVVALDGSFDSGTPTDSSDTTFTHTFESAGRYRYVSEPHRSCGMKGLIEVASIPSSGYPRVDRWLAETTNYDGEITDQTDAATVTVTVGAAGNGGNFAFDPPAVKVASGTTVEWHWTGDGGAHDVAFQDDVAESSLLAEAGTHFSHTFDGPGVYRYACRPHRGLGMKGAVIVE